MKSTNKFGSALGLAAVLALGACADMNPPANTYSSGPTYPQSTTSSGSYSTYGVVQSIEMVRQNKSASGVGLIAGALVGGIVGNQVGGGDGKKAATVIGAAGGAYAGNELEKRNQQQQAHEVGPLVLAR